MESYKKKWLSLACVHAGSWTLFLYNSVFSGFHCVFEEQETIQKWNYTKISTKVVREKIGTWANTKPTRGTGVAYTMQIFVMILEDIFVVCIIVVKSRKNNL